MQMHKTNHCIPAGIQEWHVSNKQLDIDNAFTAWDSQTYPPDFSFSVCAIHTLQAF